MAQTTDALFGGDFDIEYSSNGTAWTAIEGSVKGIDGLEQSRMTGEAYTGEGDTAVIVFGKREPIEITVNFLYTEQSGEAFEVFRAYFEAKTSVYLRFSPKGKGATGRYVYTTVSGSGAAAAVGISKFQYFDGLDAGSGDPVAGQFVLRTPAIAKTSTASSTGLGS